MTNGLKLGRGMGLPGYFFIYLCIISYLWLEAPASTLPALFHGAGVAMGLGTGFAREVLRGHQGDPLMLLFLPTQIRCPQIRCSPSRTRG